MYKPTVQPGVIDLNNLTYDEIYEAHILVDKLPEEEQLALRNEATGADAEDGAVYLVMCHFQKLLQPLQDEVACAVWSNICYIYYAQKLKKEALEKNATTDCK